MSDETLIRVRDLKRVYEMGAETVQALSGVDITICLNENVAIMERTG